MSDSETCSKVTGMSTIAMQQKAVEATSHRLSSSQPSSSSRGCCSSGNLWGASPPTTWVSPPTGRAADYCRLGAIGLSTVGPP